ncbi:CMRF35-like molecule 9 isoform X8 [Balaenoptera musculus]|uniref:CMRF35-like molecule 9 isoform X8 n=1 Tax=Balaenoptera musculus TaxID=9771 RepID=A0A8B8W2S1_BALMU|nr:CMRF35-like molecule 9 isoform X8 [Balaenoptera musculus]
MRPLVLLWGCLVLPGYGSLVGPKEISGFEGGTVSLQCTYGEELKKYRKYWCRESGFLISRCSGTVYSGEYGQEGRVSVHDSPRQLRFEVILRNLTLKDMGQYWCGVKRVGFDKTFSVSLLVFPGPLLTQQPLRMQGPLHMQGPLRMQQPFQMQGPLLTRQPLLLQGSPAKPHSWTPPQQRTPVLSPAEAVPSPAQLAMETPRKEKVHLSHLPLGNSWVPEYAGIDLAGPTGPPASPKPSASPNVEIRCLSQTSKEDEASWQTPEGDMTPGPPLPVSGDEPDFSKFISV